MPDVDLYEILGVAPDATTEQIKRAYKAQVRQTHPDAGGSAALFRLVREAHDVLTDPDRRARYDRQRTGHPGPDPGPGPQPDPDPEPGPWANRHDEPDDAGPWRQPPPATRSRATVHGMPAGTAEPEAATAIDQVPLPDHTFVFHQPRAGRRAVSHAVVAGARLLLIQVVAWAPGSYWTGPDGTVFHDGRRFDDGTAALADTCDRLAAQIGWGGPVERLLVVAPARGLPPDLVGYFTPYFTTVHLPELADVLTGWWASGADGADDGQVMLTRPEPLARLHRAVKTPTQTSVAPRPPAVPDGALTRRDCADPSGPLQTLVAVCAAVGFVATVAAGVAASAGLAPAGGAAMVAATAAAVGLVAGVAAELVVPAPEVLHDVRLAAGLPAARPLPGPWDRPTWQVSLPALVVASLWATVDVPGGGLLPAVVAATAAFPALRHVRRALGVTVGRHSPTATLRTLNKALARDDRTGLVVNVLRQHGDHPTVSAALHALDGVPGGAAFTSHVRRFG